MRNYKVIAVDFDGTLTRKDEYPNIGEPNKELFLLLKNLDRNKYKLILWTLRTGDLLKEAVNYCKNFGLEFDAINDNLEELKLEGCWSRKIFADYFLDDRSFSDFNKFKDLILKN